MKLSANFLEIAAKCSSAEELVACAEKEGISLAADEAKKILEDLKRDFSALKEKDLDKIVGGIKNADFPWAETRV